MLESFIIACWDRRILRLFYRIFKISVILQEKIAIIARETKDFVIIGLQSSTSLKRPLKHWHFVLHDIWFF